MNQNNTKHIHFIGIGGIGMSGLARFYKHEGVMVTGSDRARSMITETLENLGIEINYDQENTSIYRSVSENGGGIDMVVYTEAMSKDHPEMVAARALGVPMMNYFDALSKVANEYYLIAVAGTHGKSTTTAMLIDILEEASYDPTAIVGALRTKTKSNFRAGKSKYAIVEACEYKRDFLHLKPDVLVITNIEYEHVDYYKNLADVQDAFSTFALQVREGGAIIVNATDSNIAPVLSAIINDGHPMTVIDYRTHLNLALSLRQPGMHNRLNAAAAKAVAVFLNIEPTIINTALENFTGTGRRFEYKGEVKGAPVYDDYGHHPTEIRVTMAGARELYPNRKLIVVTQTHTYSRTAELFDDFATAYARADQVYLMPIYAAREENIFGVTSEQLAIAITKKGIPAVVMETASGIAQAIRESLNESDPAIVLIMGAGDITAVATLLTKQ